jgi:hypothetical protein
MKSYFHHPYCFPLSRFFNEKYTYEIQPIAPPYSCESFCENQLPYIYFSTGALGLNGTRKQR